MGRHNRSRVHRNQKYVNTSKHRSGEANASKVTRRKYAVTDYRKATSLTSWLFLKYGLSYKQFRNKSEKNRNALRAEYTEDTGRMIHEGGNPRMWALEDALREAGEDEVIGVDPEFDENVWDAPGGPWFKEI